MVKVSLRAFVIFNKIVVPDKPRLCCFSSGAVEGVTKSRWRIRCGKIHFVQVADFVSLVEIHARFFLLLI